MVDYVLPIGLGLSSIAITPTSATLAAGQTQKFTATATFTDGHTLDVSTLCTWVSSSTSTATIAYDGRATGVLGAGTSTISCSHDGTAAGNTATLTVTAGSLAAATYWGMAAIPGSYTAAFVFGLTNTRQQGAFPGLYAFTAGNGTTYAHWAIPSTWGDPATFRDTSTNFVISWTKVATGIALGGLTFNVWRAPQANTDAFTYDVEP